MMPDDLTDAERERFARQELRDLVTQLTDEAIATADRRREELQASRDAHVAALYGTPDPQPAPPAGGPGAAHLARISRALLVIADRLPAAGDEGPIHELRSIAATLLEP